jgi:2-polyprenyl-3-methyl-5-hydroxy-6-metoxy-1,4-benzoquinol methylase
LAPDPGGFDRILADTYLRTLFSRVHTATPEEFESYARHCLSYYSPLLPADRTLPVLDLGCGMGHFLYFLKQQGYAAHCGIDSGADQIAFCRERVTEQAELVSDSVAWLEAHEGHFAAIVCNDVLEHVPDHALFPLLHAVRGALAPEGRFVASVPNASCVTALMTRYGDLTHKRLFTETSLMQLLLSAGFVDVQLYPREQRVIHAHASRLHAWAWRARERFARFLMAELYRHLMEGAFPSIQTINLLGSAGRGDW